MIALDTNALYGGTQPNGSFQQRAREGMTLAVYNEARDNRRQSIIWAVVAIVHIMIVLFGLSLPGFTDELAATPSYALGLAFWLLGDLVYLAFFQKIHDHYQATMDRLEGKVRTRQ
jgi:hypothetical protein